VKSISRSVRMNGFVFIVEIIHRLYKVSTES
jgi:hypothetical protein